MLYGISQATVSDGTCTYKEILSTASPDSKGFYDDKNIVFQVTADLKWTQLPTYLKPGEEAKLKCSFQVKEEKANREVAFQFEVRTYYWEKLITSVEFINNADFYYLYDPLKGGPSTGSVEKEIVFKVPPRKNPNPDYGLRIDILPGANLDLGKLKIIYIHKFVE